MTFVIIFSSILLGAVALFVLAIAIGYIVKLIFGIKMFLEVKNGNKTN